MAPPRKFFPGRRLAHVRARRRTIWGESAPEIASCVFPQVLTVTPKVDNTAGLSHTVTLPPTNIGDRLILLWGDNFNDSRTITGGTWAEVLDVAGSSIFVAFRDIDGSEAATITVANTPDTTEVVYYILRLAAGTFDPAYAPEAAHTLDAANANCPNLAPTWGTEKTMWIAMIATDSTSSPITLTSTPNAYDYFYGALETGGTSTPDAMLAYGVAFLETASSDPGNFAITAQSSWDTATIAVKGFCSGALMPGLYANAPSFFAPSVGRTIGPAPFASGNTIFAPVAGGEGALHAPLLTNVGALFSPTLFRTDVEEAPGPVVQTLGAGWWSDRGSTQSKKRKPRDWVLPKAADIPDPAPPWDLVVVTPQLNRALRGTKSAWKAHLKKLRRDQDAKRAAARIVERVVEDEIIRIVSKIVSED